MRERWKPVVGFETRYEVSSVGRVRTRMFKQRYLLRTGKEAFRKMAVRTIAAQLINSGYLVVHLHFNNKRSIRLVHRLVGECFVTPFKGQNINHRNGIKTDNRASNLEWVSVTKNHRHAVSLGLRPQALSVVDPSTGVRYPSIAQASRETGIHHRTVRKWLH